MGKEPHSEITTIRLTPSQRQSVDRLAEHEERSVSGTLRRLIRIGLKEVALHAMRRRAERDASGDD